MISKVTALVVLLGCVAPSQVSRSMIFSTSLNASVRPAGTAGECDRATFLQISRVIDLAYSPFHGAFDTGADDIRPVRGVR